MGFMGCGKSTIGKLLAKKMSYAFIDVDQQIENNEGRSITDIFKLQGEEHFRDIEAELITELSKSKNTVIACGGGTPCFGNNMSVMNDSGYTVYLELNENELFTRLNNEKDNRPLITDLNEDKLKAYIQKTLSKRMPFYLQAQEVINANIKNVPEITEDILRLLP